MVRCYSFASVFFPCGALWNDVMEYCLLCNVVCCVCVCARVCVCEKERENVSSNVVATWYKKRTCSFFNCVPYYHIFL